jgi:hypothetical protein
MTAVETGHGAALGEEGRQRPLRRGGLTGSPSGMMRVYWRAFAGRGTTGVQRAAVRQNRGGRAVERRAARAVCGKAPAEPGSWLATEGRGAAV